MSSCSHRSARSGGSIGGAQESTSERCVRASSTLDEVQTDQYKDETDQGTCWLTTDADMGSASRTGGQSMQVTSIQRVTTGAGTHDAADSGMQSMRETCSMTAAVVAEHAYDIGGSLHEACTLQTNHDDTELEDKSQEKSSRSGSTLTVLQQVMLQLHEEGREMIWKEMKQLLPSDIMGDHWKRYIMAKGILPDHFMQVLLMANLENAKKNLKQVSCKSWNRSQWNCKPSTSLCCMCLWKTQNKERRKPRKVAHRAPWRTCPWTRLTLEKI